MPDFIGDPPMNAYIADSMQGVQVLIPSRVNQWIW